MEIKKATEAVSSGNPTMTQLEAINAQAKAKLTAEQVRMQMFHGMLHGAVGLQNYNVRPGALNSDGTKEKLKKIK